MSDAEAALAAFEKGMIADVVIIDMLMPSCDGMGLLQKLKSVGKCEDTIFIGITSVYSDCALRMAQAEGFAYVIAMPTSATLIFKRVDEYMNFKESRRGAAMPAKMEAASPYTLDCEEIISRYLVIMGLSPHLGGFKYAVSAIKMLIEFGVNDRLRITQNIYPAVAKMYNTNIKAVERSIRYAINSAWLRGDIEIQYQLFGYTVDSSKGCPTNKECLTMIAEHTRMRLRINLNRNNPTDGEDK